MKKHTITSCIHTRASVANAGKYSFLLKVRPHQEKDRQMQFVRSCPFSFSNIAMSHLLTAHDMYKHQTES